MAKLGRAWVIVTLAFTVPCVGRAQGGQLRWDFESDHVGAPPQGFTFGRTGKGSPGRWVVRTDPTAPAGPHVVTQVDADDTENRMPVALASAPPLEDLRLEVRCKPVYGAREQACGIVFRARGEGDYVVARASALEDDVRLYAMAGGERRQIGAWKGKVEPDAWHSLAVEARGPAITVFLDGKPVIEARDPTTVRPGQVGLWTKSDSLTYFDALVATPFGAPAQAAASGAGGGGATSGPGPGGGAAQAGAAATGAAAATIFTKGAATPSAECASCHRAVHRENALAARSGDVPAHGERPEGGVGCATCHVTPDGWVRASRQVAAPHAVLVDSRLSRSDACTPCHGLDERVPGKPAGTFLEWRDDFAQAGLGSQRCQDCHMPRTVRGSTDDPGAPRRVASRHLWSADVAGLRPGGAILVDLSAARVGAGMDVRVVNAGAGHSVPSTPGRRSLRLTVRAVDAAGKTVAEREWVFAPGNATAVAGVVGVAVPEAPLRAGEERVLSWKPSLPPGIYAVDAGLTSEPGGREAGRWGARIEVKGN